MIRILAIAGLALGLGAFAAGQRGVLTWAFIALGVAACAALAVRAWQDRDQAQVDTGRAYEAGDALPAYARRGGAQAEATSREVTSIGGRDGRAGGYMGAGSDIGANSGG